MFIFVFNDLFSIFLIKTLLAVSGVTEAESSVLSSSSTREKPLEANNVSNYNDLHTIKHILVYWVVTIVRERVDGIFPDLKKIWLKGEFTESTEKIDGSFA